MAYALMAPAVVLVGAVLAYPLTWEVWASFSELSSRVQGRRLVGLVNYRAMVAEPFFWQALATTIGYLAVTTVAKLVLGVGAGPAPVAAVARRARSSSWPSSCRGPTRGRHRHRPGTGCSIRRSSPPTAVIAGNLKHAVDGVLGAGALRVPQRRALQHLARQRRSRRSSCSPGSTRSPPSCSSTPSLETRSAWQRLRGVTAAPAPPLHGARRVPVVHHRLRRPRERLDADGRPHRLSRRWARRRTGSGSGTASSRTPPRGRCRWCRCSSWRCSLLFRWFDPPRRRGRRGVRRRAPLARAGCSSRGLALYSLFPIYFITVQSLKTPQEDVFGNPL